MRFVALVFGLLSAVLSASAGEAYTNLAGKVIAATPVRIADERVTFSRDVTNGHSGVQTLSLRIFPAEERRRIRETVDRREGRATERMLPADLRELAGEIARQRRRAEARHRGGRMTDAEFAEYEENLAGSWRHAVGESGLSPDEKSHWRGNCP